MVLIILYFVIYFYIIHENSFEYFSIFQKEGGMMQACWLTQDSLMTYKLLQTLLWGIHTAFMVIQHTL